MYNIELSGISWKFRRWEPSLLIAMAITIKDIFILHWRYKKEEKQKVFEMWSTKTLI